MKNRRSEFLGCLFALCLSAFAACGGGGGGGATSAAPAQPAKSADAGMATLNWSAPSTNSNGSALSAIGGYYVYHGTSSANYSDKIPVGNVTSYTYTGLAAGKHYFAVSAYNDAGEGPKSSEGSKTIP